MGIGLLGALEGAGQGISQVGGILMKDELEKLRMENLEKIKSGAVEKEQKFTAGQKQKDRDIKVSEGALDRESREGIAKTNAEARIKALAAKDAAAVKAGSKPTTAWKKYQELRTEFKRMNPGKDIDEISLLNAAYGSAERINTKGNEVIFTGLLGTGQQGVTAEYARPVDESGAPTGSRRSREFRNVPPPKPAQPAGGTTQKYKDGTYKRKDGTIIEIRNGKQYIKKQ